jgi:hypothetical protein
MNLHLMQELLYRNKFNKAKKFDFVIYTQENSKFEKGFYCQNYC